MSMIQDIVCKSLIFDLYRMYINTVLHGWGTVDKSSGESRCSHESSGILFASKH